MLVLNICDLCSRRKEVVDIETAGNTGTRHAWLLSRWREALGPSPALRVSEILPL